MDQDIRADSFKTNVFQVIGLFIGIGIMSYLLPITIINGIKELQTQFNTIVFSFYGLMLIVFSIFIAISQLTEQIRKGTAWEVLDTYLHDPNKGLISIVGGNEVPRPVVVWLNSAMMMILFSILFSLLFGTFLVAKPTNALNYNLPKGCSDFGVSEQGIGCVYLKGENSSSGESVMYQLVFTGILAALGRYMAKKISNDDDGTTYKALVLLFTFLAVVIGVILAMLGHIAVYGGNEAGLLGVGSLFAIGSIVMVLTGSGIFPVIFHSIFNMTLAAKSIYLTNESTLLFFMGFITLLWLAISLTYSFTIHKTVRRTHADAT